MEMTLILCMTSIVKKPWEVFIPGAVYTCSSQQYNEVLLMSSKSIRNTSMDEQVGFIAHKLIMENHGVSSCDDVGIKEAEFWGRSTKRIIARN